MRHPQIIHGGVMVQYKRRQYMEQLIARKDNGRIKVITGLRRAGNYVKSKIM